MILCCAFIFLALCLSAAASGDQGSCYTQDGQWVVFPQYQPCNGIAGRTSMCCKTNMTSLQDTCLSNGLCRNTDIVTSGYVYLREFCSGKDGHGCLNDICNKQGQNDENGIAQLTPCGDPTTTTRWCCGRSATDCCANWDNDQNALTLPLNLEDLLTSSSSSLPTFSSTSSTVFGSSSSVEPRSSSSPTSSPASGPSPTPNHGLSTGAKAGIGISSSIGGLSLLAAGFFFRHYRRSRQGKVSPAESDQGATPYPPPPPWQDYAPKTSQPQYEKRVEPEELDPQSDPVELNAQPSTAELEANMRAERNEVYITDSR